MKDNVAISINNVTKEFRVPHERYSSLKQSILNTFSPKSYSKFKSVNDVSFDIKKGEFFGIVGKNGCGKSTLLKMIANIYTPTKGSISVNGMISPFIELGVGFNPELSGKENVFLSGTILGMRRKQIEAAYDEIVAFAEMQEFMDQKLKNYSSGMQVRLAFSIATRSKSEILLIDEVLAVGDAAFQAKCLDYFYRLKEQKKTVVFVSHDMESVKKFCDRAIYIDKGKTIVIGNTSKIASHYSKENFVDLTQEGKKNTKLNKGLLIKKIEINSKKTSFDLEDAIEVHYDIHSNSTTKVILGGSIVDEGGKYIAGYNSMNDLGEVTLSKGINKFSLSIKAAQLTKGSYRLCGAIMTPKDFQLISDKLDGPLFQIISSTNYSDGVFNIQATWSKSK